MWQLRASRAEPSAKARFSRSIAVRIAIAGLLAGTALGSVMEGEARAGCGDGACGRVDWTEVTDMDQGAPAAAKLHGGYAWEASPDFWTTHPLAGTLPGYLWLTCLSPSGTSAVCKGQLAAEMAKAGTDETIRFSGSYFDYDAGAVVRPTGLFPEGETGSPAALTNLALGGSPLNPAVCPAALAVPRVGMADAAGGAGGNPSSDASPGGAGPGGSAAGSASAPSDDGGCSTAPRRAPANAGAAAWVVVAALLQVARRRSRD